VSIQPLTVVLLSIARVPSESKARLKRQTSHVPNLMQMSNNNRFCSFVLKKRKERAKRLIAVKVVRLPWPIFSTCEFFRPHLKREELSISSIVYNNENAKKSSLGIYMILCHKFNVTFSLSRSIKDIFPDIMVSFQVVWVTVLCYGSIT